MDFFPADLESYIAKHSQKESDLLKKIDRDTHLHVINPRMLSGHLQGRVLSMLTHMIHPKYILEIGTYTGYSALCMAEGLRPDGKLVTIDINAELESRARTYFRESEYASQIEFIIGDAQEIIPSLSYTWDMVFIDANKEAYSDYFTSILPQLRPGGFIIVDNVLWSGKVTDLSKKDPTTEAMRAFNDLVQSSNEVENVLFPIRDGLMIMRKL